MNLSAASQPEKKAVLSEIQLEEQFDDYLYGIIKDWIRILLIICGILFPLFWTLDFFSMPPSVHARFALYRGVTTLLIIVQLIIVQSTHPRRSGIAHGYWLSFVLGFAITKMTVDLGGMNSGYYAGLMIVIMGVNMLLSWRPIHSVFNGTMIVSIYILVNLYYFQPFDIKILANNIYFLMTTVIGTVAISWVRFNLIHSEFLLRAELVATNENLDRSREEVKKARDVLWGEMQIARQIQSAMLPENVPLKHYETSALMMSAIEVGGDYYDIIQINDDESWVAIGDVSGHGVTSGLIMMMAQTSIRSILIDNPEMSPSQVLDKVNQVIKENVEKLDMDRYMTIVLFRLTGNQITFAGKHTDFMIYHAASQTVELVETEGSWLGVVNDLGSFLTDKTIFIAKGDTILLYTDGVVELENEAKEQFGEERLKQLFQKNATLPVNDINSIIVRELHRFHTKQEDDISLVILKYKG